MMTKQLFILFLAESLGHFVSNSGGISVTLKSHETKSVFFYLVKIRQNRPAVSKNRQTKKNCDFASCSVFVHFHTYIHKISPFAVGVGRDLSQQRINTKSTLLYCIGIKELT